MLWKYMSLSPPLRSKRMERYGGTCVSRHSGCESVASFWDSSSPFCALTLCSDPFAKEFVKKVTVAPYSQGAHFSPQHPRDGDCSSPLCSFSDIFSVSFLFLPCASLSLFLEAGVQSGGCFPLGDRKGGCGVQQGGTDEGAMGCKASGRMERGF